MYDAIDLAAGESSKNSPINWRCEGNTRHFHGNYLFIGSEMCFWDLKLLHRSKSWVKGMTATHTNGIPLDYLFGHISSCHSIKDYISHTLTKNLVNSCSELLGCVRYKCMLNLQGV